MIGNVRIFSSLLLLALLSFTALEVGASHPPDIRVHLPSTVVDGETLVATVELSNSSADSIDVATSPYANLRPKVTTIESVDTGCLVRRTVTERTPRVSERRILQAHERAEVLLNLENEFPLGLRPGRYTLSVEYRDGHTTIKSVETPFSITTPSEESAKEYASFIETCRAIVIGSDGATSRVLDFARSYPSFIRTDSLLNLGRLRATGETRVAIDQLLVQRESRYAAAAKADLIEAERIRVAAERRAAWESQHRELMRNPENRQAVDEFHALTTIHESPDFAIYERFLARHPKSFLAPVVIQRMINAVQEGIVPTGYGQRDRDQAVRVLYDRLMTEYPDSYHAKEAAEVMRRGRWEELPK